MHNPLLPVRAVKLPHYKSVGTGPRTGTCVNWGGPIAIVPCLHQCNIYIKRKLRIWRVQKCIPVVSAKTPLTCADRQTTPSQGSRCRPENGNLHKLGWTCHHGAVFAPRQYLYQKEAMGMERPEMYCTSRCTNLNLPRFKGVGIGLRTETCINFCGPITMVPCLHQGNIYIKRKIRVWRDQKCIPLIGVKIPVTCVGRGTTTSQGCWYMAITQNCVNWGGPTVMVPCLYQDNIYISETTQSQGSRYRPDN